MDAVNKILRIKHNKSDWWKEREEARLNRILSPDELQELWIKRLKVSTYKGYEYGMYGYQLWCSASEIGTVEAFKKLFAIANEAYYAGEPIMTDYWFDRYVEEAEEKFGVDFTLIG